MIRLRAALALAVTLVVAAASSAQFGRFDPTPAPLAVTLLNAIDNPNLVAELKLTEDQVKKLVARRQEVWDEAYTTAPTKYTESNAARIAATDALLKKTLDADQYRRLVQLGGQNVLSGFRSGWGSEVADSIPAFPLTSVTSATLIRYPELVAAFRLTDEQKQQLTAPSNPVGGRTQVIAMKPEQTAAAKGFLGEVFAKALGRKTDPRTSRSLGQPSELFLLAAKDVRAEVNLTEEQAKPLALEREKWTKFSNDSYTDLSPKDANDRFDSLSAETEKFMAATLKPEQAVRLKQIAFQTNTIGRDIGQLYKNVMVAKELAISDHQ